MFDPANDPSGNSLRQRASMYKSQFDQAGQDEARQHGQLVGFGGLGPLQDPMWQGLFQALDEQEVDKVAGASPSPTTRYSALPEAQMGYAPTFNPQFQRSAVTGKGMHQNMPLQGLMGAR